MNENIRTSALLRASFLASAKVGQLDARGNVIPGTMTLTAASAAGLLLELHGSARAAFDACTRLPMDGPWPAAARYLAAVVAAEMAETMPPIAETGT